MIVDPCAIVVAKDEPRLALRIPDDVPPLVSGTGDKEGLIIIGSVIAEPLLRPLWTSQVTVAQR